MPGIARANDIACGVCYCHETPISTCGILIPSQDTLYVNSQPAIKISDVIITFCGHISIVVSSSSISYVNKQNITRNSDFVCGCMIGTIITGSSNVISS